MADTECVDLTEESLLDHLLVKCKELKLDNPEPKYTINVPKCAIPYLLDEGFIKESDIRYRAYYNELWC